MLEKVPFFVLAIGAAIVAFIAQQKGGAVASLQSFTLTARCTNAATSYVGYLLHAVWPAGLVPFYPYALTVHVWNAAGAVLVLAAVTATVVWQARRRPYLAVGWFWFAGMILPVSGIVQVGSHAMADRYTYVPLIGLFVMIAWAVREWVGTQPVRKWVVAIAAGVVVVASATAARAQVLTWGNSTTLWRHAVDVGPRNYYAQNALGLELVKQGRTAEAAEHFAEASRLASGFPNGHNNLGQLLAERGEVEQAMVEYRKALDIAPDYLEARTNLAKALVGVGRVAEAVEQFEQALRVHPDSQLARSNLGNALLAAGRREQALSLLQDGISIDPASGPARVAFANALQRGGMCGEAVAQYEQALALQGVDVAEALTNLGATLLCAGRPADAETRLLEAIRLAPDSAAARNNLGNAYLQAGRPAEAAGQYRLALRADVNFADAHMNLGSALFDLGLLEEAEREQRRAVQLAPQSPSAHFNLADTLRRRSNLAEALSEYAETLRLEGPSTQVQTAMGVTLERMGRLAEAAAMYRAALQLEPNASEALAGLARTARTNRSPKGEAPR